MARYISKAAGFKKTVIKGEQTLIQGPQGPQISILREPFIAIFEQGNVTPWEIEKAAEVWGDKFKGVAEGDLPLKRISGFDTEEVAARMSWDAETKKTVEALLDAQQGQDYIRVDLPRADAPWASYDEIDDAEQIALITAATGASVSHVRKYELENLNRKDVLDALDELVAEADSAVASDETLVEA